MSPATRALGLATLTLAMTAGPAVAAPVTAQPSGAFTDSVGTNVFLNSSRSATEIGTTLTDLGTTHVRSSLESNNVAVSEARVIELMNAIPGLKLNLLAGMMLHNVYKPNNSRMLPSIGTGGWTALLGALDRANYIATHGPDDKVVSIEGVNEANGAWEPTTDRIRYKNGKKCANGWIERAADQQRALWEYLNGGNASWSLAGLNPGAHPALKSQAKLADWSNGKGCALNASSLRPFLESQKDFTVDYAGFPAWNAGGTTYNGTVASLLPGASSVQSTTELANVHAYPPANATPEWMTSSAAAVDYQGYRDCGTTPLPGDTAKNLTTGLPEAGLKTCAALKAGVPAGGAQRPIIMTETGYQTSAVADTVRATYYPRLLLSNFRYGITRTYLFDLFNDANNALGLIQGGQKTLAYYSVKNTLSLLKQSGSPTPASLDLTFSGATESQVSRQLFRTSPTTWALVLSPTDSVSGTGGSPLPRVAPPTRNVGVTLNGGGLWNATFQSPTPASTTANGPRTVQAAATRVNTFNVNLSGDTVVVTLTAG